MAKTATQRRQSKRCASLQAVRNSDSVAFTRMWGNFLIGWLSEVRTRVRDQNSGDRAERRLRVFEVLALARLHAQSAGVMNDPHVALSLITLKHECAKAVAGINDPRLYAFNEYATSRIPG